MPPADDFCNYDKIMLSFKEKWVLRRMLRKKEVPDTFCTAIQKETFLKYGLIRIQQNQSVTSTGRVVPDVSSPKYIQTTDKAFRYLLYRKESYFKGKFQVIIAFLALIKSCDTEICWLIHFIADCISNL